MVLSYPPRCLPNKDAFLRACGLPAEAYRRCGYSWDELRQTYTDYLGWYPDLEREAAHGASVLQCYPGVRGVYSRAKDPQHLVEKLIRKSWDLGRPYATVRNYLRVVPDLVGIRGLHVFKEDWPEVHRFICENFDVEGRPEAKVRQGDPAEVVDMYRKSCDIKETGGYRSVHYCIAFRCRRRDFKAELQVRTLFEEAWGEGSHRIDYPRPSQTPLLVQYVSMFTDAAGLCDDLASAARLVKAIDSLGAQRSAVARKKQRELCVQLLAKLDSLQQKSPAAARLAFPPSRIPPEVALRILQSGGCGGGA